MTQPVSFIKTNPSGSHLDDAGGDYYPGSVRKQSGHKHDGLTRGEPTPGPRTPLRVGSRLWQDFCGNLPKNSWLDAWSGSMGPFMLGRLMEKAGGFARRAYGMSKPSRRMATGGRGLRVCGAIDRQKMALVVRPRGWTNASNTTCRSTTAVPSAAVAKAYKSGFVGKRQMSGDAGAGKICSNGREPCAVWNVVTASASTFVAQLGTL